MFLADDSVLIREGVAAMLARQSDFEVVGVADDYDSLIEGAERLAPDVVVSDIRMPPSFDREGIDACQWIRKRHPGTGIVILSQYDDPDYAIALLSEGAAGYAYLLKDHIAEGDQLARAIREVATGGSMLDPAIVATLVNPVRRTGDLDRHGERVAGDGRRGKADQGDRRRAGHDAGGGGGRRRAAVPAPRRGRVGGRIAGALRAPEAAAHRDLVPRGAGRVAVAAAAHRRRRSAAQPGQLDRRRPSSSTSPC